VINVISVDLFNGSVFSGCRTNRCTGWLQRLAVACVNCVNLACSVHMLVAGVWTDLLLAILLPVDCVCRSRLIWLKSYTP